ncbi:30869_t:CDS:2, partial [Gigaspora margarita]
YSQNKNTYKSSNDEQGISDIKQELSIDKQELSIDEQELGINKQELSINEQELKLSINEQELDIDKQDMIDIEQASSNGADLKLYFNYNTRFSEKYLSNNDTLTDSDLMLNNESSKDNDTVIQLLSGFSEALRLLEIKAYSNMTNNIYNLKEFPVYEEARDKKNSKKKVGIKKIAFFLFKD